MPGATDKANRYMQNFVLGPFNVSRTHDETRGIKHPRV